MNFAPYTFQYGNFLSEEFGLRFAHFNTEEPEQVGGDYTHNTYYLRGGHRRVITTFFQEEKNCLEFDVEIMAENGLTESAEEAVYKALFNAPSFKKLKVHDSDDDFLENRYLMCIFTNPQKKIAIMDGSVVTVGYKCTALIDSPWSWEDKSITITPTGGEEEYIQTIQTPTLFKDYINPKVTIDVGESGGLVSIVNVTDNNRETRLADVSASSHIVMEPQYCKISYNGEGNIWTKFAIKHFLRLVAGDNMLVLSGDITSVTIEYQEAHIL